MAREQETARIRDGQGDESEDSRADEQKNNGGRYKKAILRPEDGVWRAASGAGGAPVLNQPQVITFYGVDQRLIVQLAL